MMESEGSSIKGTAAQSKATTVTTGKAYAGYVAPAAEQKPAAPAKQVKQNTEKPVVLPTGGNIGTAPASQDGA